MSLIKRELIELVFENNLIIHKNLSETKLDKHNFQLSQKNNEFKNK